MSLMGEKVEVNNSPTRITQISDTMFVLNQRLLLWSRVSTDSLPTAIIKIHLFVLTITNVVMQKFFNLNFNIWMFPKIVVPPNHPILIGFSIINHPFWGTPIFGNTHIVVFEFNISVWTNRNESESLCHISTKDGLPQGCHDNKDI